MAAERLVILREIAQSPRDLFLDVQRLLAVADAPGVAGLDELADLGREQGVGRGAREGRELGVDVERLLALAHPARVARLEHLADLGLALGGGHGGRGLARGAVGLVAQREGAAARLLGGAPRAAESDGR